MPRIKQLLRDGKVVRCFGFGQLLTPKLVAILGESRLKLWRPAKSILFLGDLHIVAAISGDDKDIILCDATTGKRLRNLRGHQLGIHCLAYDPRSQQLVSGSVDRSVRVWNPANPQAEGRELFRHDGGVFSLAFSSDGRFLASAGRVPVNSRSIHGPPNSPGGRLMPCTTSSSGKTPAGRASKCGDNTWRAPARSPVAASIFTAPIMPQSAA